MSKTAAKSEEQVFQLAAPKQLVFNAAETSVRLGGLVSAYWLERKAAAAEIPCTYIAGHLGFTDEHMAWLIQQGVREPETYGRAKQ